jgi:prolyl-tRNA synthetase|tara:strand:+ start:1931 stop:2233 length:303 start_codon:yes stop_codon:yes gene_type:complete
MVLAPWCEMQDTEEWVKEQTRETENAADGAVVAVAAEGGAAPEVDEDAGKGAALTGAAKTLCIPFSQNPIPEGTLCFTSVAGSPGEGKLATSWALWGRSY